MRFPNAQSPIPLLNVEINDFSYEEGNSTEESSETEYWEGLVDEEKNSSEDSFQEARVNVITDRVKTNLGLVNKAPARVGKIRNSRGGR